jgi:hypothetical protein
LYSTQTSLRGHGLDPSKYLLVGRDIFRIFLGNPNLYDTVIDLIRGTGGQVDIFGLMEKKVKELAEELRKTLRRRRGQAAQRSFIA